MPRVIGSSAEATAQSRAARFASDRSGGVAIIFALTALVVVAMVGGAIDYGRAVRARYQIQEAVDSAVLAAARVWQTENDIDLAQKKGLEHYKNNKPREFDSEVTQFTPDFTKNTISMVASGTVPTPFLSIIHHYGYTVGASSQAMLQIGGNGERSLEIAMMLDVTGSMQGQKIEDLKAAAKDLVDIVVWDDQSEYQSRVAIIPFAEAVDVGSSALADSVRGTLKPSKCLTSKTACTSYIASGPETDTGWIWGKPATWYQFDKSGKKTNTYKVSSLCVTERTGTEAYTDAAPSTTANKVGPAYLGTSDTSCTIASSADTEVNSVQPLSSDKAMLKRRIDKLTIAGSTAGHLGTAWAWYMLSPNWAYLWPSANQPVAYGTDKLDKIAILMTDGEYNTMYCHGAEASDSSSADINCKATNGSSTSQARTLCTNMKAKGIVVYTVGFQLDTDTAKDTLKQCASSEDKFYDAADGDALRLAFRDIAVRLATLRLSQ